MTRAFVGLILTSVVFVSCSSGGEGAGGPTDVAPTTSMLPGSPSERSTASQPPAGDSRDSATEPARPGGSTPSSATPSGPETGFGGVRGTTLPSGEVRLRAIVGSVDSRQGRIELEEPVSGYSVIEVSSNTEFRLSEGEPGAVSDVEVGGPISATGRPGDEGVLLAELVVLLDA